MKLSVLIILICNLFLFSINLSSKTDFNKKINNIKHTNNTEYLKRDVKLNNNNSLPKFTQSKLKFFGLEPTPDKERNIK